MTSIRSKVIKIGGSKYIKLDDFLRERVKSGDWVEYEVKTIVPANSDVKMWVGRYEHPITDHMAKKAQDSLYYDFAQEATIISFSIESSEVQPR